MDEKWEELRYELVGPGCTRSLVITPHFQKVPDGWFDGGKYTIAEDGKDLGNLYMDLYTDRPLQWDGNKEEFSAKELEAIADHIFFKDVAHLPDPF